MAIRPRLRSVLWLYLVILGLLAVAATSRNDNILFWVFGVMVAVLLLTVVGSFLTVRRLEVRRVIPSNGGVGEPLIVRYAVTNTRRLLPAFNLHFEERRDLGGANWQRLMEPASAWVMHAGPCDQVHGESIYWPTARGAAQFDALRVQSSFPFGIVPFSRTLRQPQRALVYPRLYRLRRRVLESITPTGPMGMRVTQHAGAGDDFYGLREFRDGDSLRHVCWKRLANRDELVAIERANPSPARFRIVLDLTTPTDQLPGNGVDPREREERAISLAASIVHGADHEGFEVGLAVAGFEGSRIEIQRGVRHRRRLMARLAEIDLDAPRTPPERASGDRDTELEHAGVVVIHPGRIQPGIVAGDAWHFSVDQMEHLVDETIGWWELDADERRAAAGPEHAA